MPNFRRKAASTVSRITQRGRQRAQPTQTAGPSVLEAIEQNDHVTESPGSESGSEDSQGSSTTTSLSSTNATTDSSFATTPEPQDGEGNWTYIQPRHRNFNHTLHPIIDSRPRPRAQSNASAAPNRHPPRRHLATDRRSIRGTGNNHRASTHQAPRQASSHRAFSHEPRQQERPACNRIDISQITPGTILFHREVVIHYNDEQAARAAATNDGTHVFQTYSGDWYIEKGRFFFVLNVFANHWTECPIYTYGSRGLHDNMSDALKKEHIGLKPMRISIDQYNQQNEYAPINVRYMQNPNRQLSDKAVIHVTQLRSSNFNTKVEIVAYTDGHAVNRVSSLRTRLGCF